MQTVRLAALFQQEEEQLTHAATIPPLAQILNEVASRRKKAALERATTIFHALRVVGVAYGLAVAAWLLHLLSHLGNFNTVQTAAASITPMFSHLDVSMNAVTGNAVTGSYALGGLLAFLLCIASGVWITLRDERVAG
ncbi:hypothetical protein [Silvibacterium sp.]|uniref:hypothetical protein n=1 Tax=Silvibacterium sp. TaxID=1964179 RepID=UPI0039E57526